MAENIPASLLAATVALGSLDWLGVLLILLPIWYFGRALTHLEAYCEHFGATPGDRRTNRSVAMAACIILFGSTMDTIRSIIFAP